MHVFFSDFITLFSLLKLSVCLFVFMKNNVVMIDGKEKIAERSIQLNKQSVVLQDDP